MTDTLTITYLGHATCLLEGNGVAVLTDPHLGDRVGFMHRQTPIHYNLGALPELTAIIVSHTHIDHLDVNSFKFFRGTVPVIVPPGTAHALHPFVNNPVIELAHWVPHRLHEQLTITPVPVRHFGGRILPHVRFRAVSGYIIALGSRTIYFAGDTAYGTHFREVGQMYTIDLALLPIGGLFPRWCSPAKPLSPPESITAMTDLRAKQMIPTHWGTFGSGTAKLTQLDCLRDIATERGLSERVRVLEPGGGSCELAS